MLSSFVCGYIRCDALNVLGFLIGTTLRVPLWTFPMWMILGARTAWQGRYILVSKLVAQLPSRPPDIALPKPLLGGLQGWVWAMSYMRTQSGIRHSEGAAMCEEALVLEGDWYYLVFPHCLFCLPCGEVQWVGNFGCQCHAGSPTLRHFWWEIVRNSDSV